MSLPEQARVAIVGGGFAGAATAWALVQRGLDGVVVIEREAACGQHASGRNAALCRQLTDDNSTTRFTVPGARFLASPPAGFSEVPLLARTGSILVGDDPSMVTELHDRAKGHGIRCHAVGVPEIVARWPLLDGLRGAGGVYFDDDGTIDVAALLRGFLAGAARGGATIVTSCQVDQVVPRGDGARLSTSKGILDAQVVVDAAGAWAGVVGDRMGSIDSRFSPVKRHLFMTAPVVVDRAAPYVWQVGAEQLYLRVESSGVLISPCDGRVVDPDDGKPDPEAAERLAERVRLVAPGLSSLQIERTWSCLRTFAPERRFRIGWDRHVPWMFWVAGLAGHGATACSAIGRAAAELIAKRC